MRYEVPSSVVRGEQIAIKLALFNPWMQDLEVLVDITSAASFKSISSVTELTIKIANSKRLHTLHNFLKLLFWFATLQLFLHCQ